jgi:hypothetical protein
MSWPPSLNTESTYRAFWVLLFGVARVTRYFIKWILPTAPGAWGYKVSLYKCVSSFLTQPCCAEDVLVKSQSLLDGADRTSWSIGQHSYFVFGRYRVQMSAGDWISGLEVFVGFSVPPGECRDSTLRLGHERFLPNLVQFIHISTFRYIVTLTEMLNKL